MTHDVFISYSTKDKVVADAIVAALEQQGFRCWYAPRDIKPGAGWGEAITDAIGECKIFVMVFSKNSNQSKRVLEEVFFAISEEKSVIPFRIENIDPTGAMRLHLSMLHWLDAYQPSWRAHLDRLIDSVSADLGRKVAAPGLEKAPAAPAVSVTEKKKKAPWLWIGLAVALTVLLGASGFWWLGNRPKNTEPQPTALAQIDHTAVVIQSPTQAQPSTSTQASMPLATATHTFSPSATATRTPSPSATTTPTRTLRPPATATPPSWATEFANPIKDSLGLHPPNELANFDGALPQWLRVEKCPDFAQPKVSGGELIFMACEMDWTMWYTDFAVEMDVRHVDNTNIEWVFQFRGGPTYRFLSASVERFESNWYTSEPNDQIAVSLEKPYRVLIIVQGYETALYLNDKPVLYGSLPGGFKNGEARWNMHFHNGVVAFDKIAVWDLNNLE
jgi:hypothetical protein